MNYVVGVDIGGTFTDCVVVDEAGQITIGKALSSPDDFFPRRADSMTNAASNLGLLNANELLQRARLFFTPAPSAITR